ncbi:MAG: GNAT family N-acetyltransferase [Ignavibacteriales bacterium]|nr:GNAT family N-acetyltransferase [Ignavibacteriales bacterium]
MKTINLLNIGHATLRLLQTDTEQFCRSHNVQMGQNAGILLDVVAQTTKLMTTVGGDPKWFGYLAIDTSTRQMVGTCAFKGAPTKERSVEIAYFTFPVFEGKGYATAMASMLIHAAQSSPEVDSVIAHTLPETNASTRILQKVGMKFLGEVIDLEDGRVWRWSLDPG